MNFTNTTNLSDSFAAALSYNDYDHVENTLSATSLISPPYLKKLQDKHKDDIIVDVTDRVWALLGTATHLYAEKANKDRFMSEMRLFADVEETRISGKADIYDQEKHIIEDFKTTSKFAVSGGKIKPEWEQQLNILAYIFKQNDLEVKGLKINAIIRDYNFNDRFDSYLPDHNAITIDIPLWSEIKQYEFIKERILLHMQNDSDHCSPEERWARETKYAVKKQGAKRAVKLCDTEAEAQMYIDSNYFGDPNYIIEHRAGQNVRCERYCNVNKFCKFYSELAL